MLFSCSSRATKRGCKPLKAFSARQFGPQVPDMAYGLVRTTLRRALSNMIFSTVRITGENWQPNEIIHRFNIPECTVWHRGDTFEVGKGRTHKNTGFAFSLPDADSWVAGLPLVMSMLELNRELFQTVAAIGLKAELSIGVTVGEEASFAPSLDLPLKLIAALHSANVAMEINAYPTSDE